MHYRKLTSLLAIACIATIAKADDFGDSWLTINTPNIELSDSVSTKSHLEFRFPDSDTFGYYRFSQKVYTKLGDKWKLGTHPVFENSKSGDNWKHTYRLDLELNPGKFKLSENGPTISMRNRWELRWKEGKGSEIFHRIRQSTKASWKVDLGPFSSYTVGNEVFFEEDKGKISMNRFYPVMLGTKIADKVKATYYLLYQSKRAGTSSDWSGAYILGASLSF